MISFPQNLVLENKRVLLTPLQLSDLPNLLPFAIQEQDLWHYSMINPAGEAGMKTYVSTAVSQREAQKEYPFLIYDKLAGAYAGSTRFYDIQPAMSSTQLGYTWYGKQFQRTGLNRHCKMLMLTYAFEQWGMERVEFRADNKNERSINAMKAIGCTVEGVLRSTGPSADPAIRRDSIILSILKQDWLNGVREGLQQKIQPA